MVKVKNGMSWVDLRAWLHYCRESIVRSYVDNVYYGGSGKFIFKLRPLRGEVAFLLVEPGRRVHFTKYKLGEYRASPEIIALRRRIRDKRIEDVEMLGLERILKFKFKSRTLLVELLPRGVLLVLDENGNIEFSTEYREMRDRSILKGEKYTPPPSRVIDVEELHLSSFLEKISRGKDLVRGLVLGLSLPGEVAEEAVYRAGLDKKLKPTSLKSVEARELLENLRGVLEESLLGRGYIVKSLESLVTVTPFKPESLRGEYEVLEYQSFNDALDDYFYQLDSASWKPKAEVVKKLEVAIKEQEEKLRETIETASKHRSIAEKLLSNPRSFRELEECVDKAFKSKDLECLKKWGLTFIDRKKKLVKLKILNVEVEFYEGDNIYKVASRLYSKARELEDKAERIKRAIEELREKVKRESVELEDKALVFKAEKKPVEWYERYHWAISEDGTLIVGGRDAHQNEAVVKKYLEPTNVFVHAEVRGAPAVVVKCRGEPSQQALREATLIAACYSKAWKERLGSVDVYWVRGGQVSKSPPPGQYLPKGSFMVYGKRNYVRNVELKLALGVEVYRENYVRVVVGSEENVSKKTKYYFLLVPGENSKNKVADRIKKILVERVEPSLKPLMKSIKIEELVARIPGPSKIVGISEALKSKVES